MEAVVRTHRVWNSRVSTGKLNRWLEGILAHHPPPAVAGRRLKIKYLTQAKTRPPGFVVSCSRPDAMPQSYVRYLTNSLREAFDMPGCRSAWPCAPPTTRSRAGRRSGPDFSRDAAFGAVWPAGPARRDG